MIRALFPYRLSHWCGINELINFKKSVWITKETRIAFTTASSRLSFEEAHRRLGLPPHTKSLSLVDLRQAYFTAAKECHPDMRKQQNHESSSVDANADDFLKLTEAYEFLQRGTVNVPVESLITQSEEDSFRKACMQDLGLSAEVVEECKQDPMFRQWLGGKTDSAQHWTMFLMQNGGLAPKLRPRAGWLTAGESVTNCPLRRKR